MKVTKICINDFHQFKDLEIDLTYPKGHVCEGEPLKKVCFIGQSGTGKTTLLEIIGGLTHNAEELRYKYGFSNTNGYLSIKNFDLEYNQRLTKNDKIFFYTVFNCKKQNEEIDSKELIALESEYIKSVKPNLISYPAELKYAMNQEFDSIDFKEREVIDFSIENATAIWNLILNDVKKYQEEELKIRQKISRVVEDNTNDFEAIKRALLPLEALQKNNFNPIVDLAEKCLNPILEKFRLRVKTQLDIQKKDDIGFIKIEDFEGNEIPYGLWSTGTKQVVLSALPLYLLKPKYTIILFDEPERSLYPDLQQEIIDYYLSFTNDCQLFFSTHSPIIASCFEPWEIVELKFKERNVIQDLYYEGERHVDNYTITPNYLTYDLILSKVFDLKETHSSIRDEKITGVLMLRNQLEKMKQDKKLHTKAGKALTEKYLKLAKQLAWDFKIPVNEEA
ncbi:MAG: AAA family ATPase [Flavobacterium sp.]|nr:AAA family ATPase [Flavobacterium sp.]